MTPEATQFMGVVVQTIRKRLLSPRHLLLQRPTGRGTQGYIMFWRDMMLLGSVLLPEKEADDQGVKPPHYLDDAGVRELIAAELAYSPFDFYHEVNTTLWAPAIPFLGSRFYQIDTAASGGWGYTLVPSAAERDAEDSTIPADAVVLPDFSPVTNKMRYRAIGA